SALYKERVASVGRAGYWQLIEDHDRWTSGGKALGGRGSPAKPPYPQNNCVVEHQPSGNCVVCFWRLACFSKPAIGGQKGVIVSSNNCVVQSPIHIYQITFIENK